MDELEREVLDVAREARAPTDADRERIRRLVAASIAGVAGAGVAGAGAVASAATKTWWTAAWVKGVGLAVVVATAGTSAWVATRDENAETTTARAPAEMREPEPPLLQLEAIEPPPLEEEAEAPRPRRPRRPATTSRLGEELELLHAAQAAWRGGDASGALTLVREHEARWRRSQLAQERSALRILALCDLGRVDEARRLGRRFLQSASASPSRRSVEESCARE